MSSKSSSRADWAPYVGKPKLVIAIDLGTTFSGASYVILQPGVRPTVEDIKAYPGQSSANSKVPSVILYDKNGTARLFGAEAVAGGPAEQLLEEGGQLAKWWKVHLKPDHLDVRLDLQDLQGDAKHEDVDRYQELPFGLDAEQICSDFLKYMVTCVGAYIRSRDSNGLDMLANLAPSAEYVLTIPNGWEIEQQHALRRACVTNGLVPASRSHAISFVSEAEASVNFCARSAGSRKWCIKAGQDLIVCDAGGGTVDISSYRVCKTAPRIVLEETFASTCLIAGSTTVDCRARELLTKRLKGTRWDNADDLAALETRFSETIKEAFVSAEDQQYLTIGSASESLPEKAIRRGKLVLSGTDVADLFEVSLSDTQEAIEERITSETSHTLVAMVGGFSESVYFREELQARLGDQVKLYKPDEATAKAVANGAIAWYLDGLVTSRIAKVDYGIQCAKLYRRHEASHAARKALVYKSIDGRHKLPGSFSTILSMGSKGATDQEFIESYSMTFTPDETLEREIKLWVYRREEGAPVGEFIDEPGFKNICSFRANMEPFRSIIPVRQTAKGRPFLEVSFKLAMRLTGTELQAQTIFQHGGQTFRGPAATVIASQT